MSVAWALLFRSPRRRILTDRRVRKLLEFPTIRRDPESGYTLHGRRFDDPYAWLERLDDPETQEWIAAQEAVTRGLLSAVPGRDWLGLATRCWSSPCPLRTARWSRSARP